MPAVEAFSLLVPMIIFIARTCTVDIMPLLVIIWIATDITLFVAFIGVGSKIHTAY